MSKHRGSSEVMIIHKLNFLLTINLVGSVLGKMISLYGLHADLIPRNAIILNN
ncbi:MAG: hypothetical protein HRU40_06130 [Saprospiraceae bacterium]|nr:hypothetical protein [Saprospiraceae bacterium]